MSCLFSRSFNQHQEKECFRPIQRFCFDMASQRFTWWKLENHHDSRFVAVLCCIRFIIITWLIYNWLEDGLELIKVNFEDNITQTTDTYDWQFLLTSISFQNQCWISLREFLQFFSIFFDFTKLHKSCIQTFFPLPFFLNQRKSSQIEQFVIVFCRATLSHFEL